MEIAILRYQSTPYLPRLRMEIASLRYQSTPRPEHAPRAIWAGRAARSCEAASTARGWASTAEFESGSDLRTILREADPARAKEKLAKAQDNPELDAALAHAQRPSVLPSEASPSVPEPAGSAGVAQTPERVPPPVVVATAPEARRRKRARFPAWAKACAAVIAVVGPVTLLWVLLVRPRGQERGELVRGGVRVANNAAPSGLSTAQVPSVGSAVPVPRGAAVPGIEEDAGAAPAVQVERDASAPKPNARPKPSEDDPYSAQPKKPGAAKPDSAPMIF